MVLLIIKMLKNLLPCLISAIISYLASGANVDQGESRITVNEGTDVTLNCIYSDTKYVLIWYMQKTSNTLTLVLQDQSRKHELSEEFRERFSAHHNPMEKTFHLTIRRSQRSDSATYYCAFEHVGATHAGSLTFGAGTKLIVEPGEKDLSLPSVFVLKSQREGDSSTACLLKDFYPRDVEIYMNSTTQNLPLIKATPLLFLKGKYSAVHVGKLQGEDVQCLAKHQGKWVRDGDITARPKDPIHQNEPPDMETEKCEQTTEKPPVQNSERMNTLSMTVLGLRILCVKALAFNLLLTAKYFLC